MRLAAELRCQINQLSAAMQLLTPAIREECGQHYDPYLAIANQSIFRLLRTINHLELISQPTPNGFHPVELDLEKLCCQTVELISDLARQTGMTFEYEGPSTPIFTCGDAFLLRQMLLTLISNTLRWAKDGGVAGLRLTTGHTRAIITLWDKGPGLRDELNNTTPPSEEELMHQLLNPHHGVGLGLPAARQIASLHQGTLVLEQQDGQPGLRATISLPLCQPEELTLHTPTMGMDPSGGFSPALVELSDALPSNAFLPDDAD